jgi:hypothetical protein
MFTVFKVYPSGKREIVAENIASDWQARQLASQASGTPPGHCIVISENGETHRYRDGVPVIR